MKLPPLKIPPKDSTMMTNANMTPPDADTLKQVANKAQSIDDEAAMLANASEVFEDQVAKDAALAAKHLEESNKEQEEESGKAIGELIEKDAYDLSVPIRAGAMYDPDVLKVVLKNKNYIARWANRNPVRIAQLRARGFVEVSMDEVEPQYHYNLEMFTDSQDHLVYADLVCMKIQKDVYYAGLRRAFIKSKYATNDREASKAGAQFAKENLNGQLRGQERSYMSEHQGKPIYNPNIGI